VQGEQWQGEESSSSRGKRSRERGRGRKSKSGKEKRGKSGARAVVRERACKGGGERSRCRSRVGAPRYARCADAQCVLATLRAQRLTSPTSGTGTMVCIGTSPQCSPVNTGDQYNREAPTFFLLVMNRVFVYLIGD
jgi:hypothetical protein